MAELSGLEVLGLVKEIDSTLRGAYVNNIYTFGPSQLIRFRKPDAGDHWLVVSPKLGVWISKKVSDRAETNEFTSKLRGELERARFVEAKQVDLDRIFELELEGKERRKLIVELMPPGNIIVVDSDGIVRLALEEVRSSKRRVLRGRRYEQPKSSRLSPALIVASEVEDMLRSETTVGKAIGRHVALPRKYIAETLARLEVSENDPSTRLKGREEDVAHAIRKLVEEARDEPKPCIATTVKGDDIFVVPPRGAEIKERGDTVSELCDLLMLEAAGKTIERPSPEEEKRHELEVTIAELRSRATSLTADAERFRSAARLAASSSLDEALGTLRDSGLKLASEPSTPAAISSALFDGAKKLEVDSRDAMTNAEKLEKKMPRPKPRQKETRPLQKRRQEWYEKFRWFFTTEGRLAVGGRDAQSNSMLLSRHLEPKDTVYHADLFGSPFFLLKGGSTQSEDEAREVAIATVAFSSAWKTGLGSADAYWIDPEQVSSAAPSGEYLPRGSFSIRGKKNFMSKSIVEVAIGTDTSGRVMAGPEEAIRSHCTNYVVLRPHREKTSDTAKRVLSDLITDAHTGVAPPSLDEVLRALPSGGGKVVRKGITRA